MDGSNRRSFAMRIDFVLAVGLGVMLIGGIFSTARAAETPKATTQDVTGIVNDALGRPIAGAKLTLQNGQGKTAAETTSDNDGHFIFSGVDRLGDREGR
jgi:hypothetical protein